VIPASFSVSHSDSQSGAESNQVLMIGDNTSVQAEALDRRDQGTR